MNRIIIVLLLFICNSCNRYESVSTIPDELVGNWFDFLTNRLTTDLYRKFDITVIPRYLLIDKSGNIVNEHAPRPSHKEQLIKQIEDLI